MIHYSKSLPAPVCLDKEKLKKEGNYKCGDVIDRLYNDFHGKCYICQDKGFRDINIEHFIPHGGDNTLRCDWGNLFYCCSYCNKVKSTDKSYNNIINCTDSSENIEELIVLKFDNLSQVVSINISDDKASTINTKDLLDKVYNGTEPTTQLIRKGAFNLREDIEKEINEFNYLLSKYTEGDSILNKNDFFLFIKKHLLPSSKFTSFKRRIIRDFPVLHDEFGTYC